MLHILFALSLAIVALLYSSVGQAGGTGYVALLGLAGFTSAVIKPSALALNILVSAIGCVRFYRAGLVTWRTCYPFPILGLPFSLLGGALHIPSGVYQKVVGSLLLIAGVQMLCPVSGHGGEAHPRRPPFMPSLVAGGVLDVLSGVTGVGGAIFLAPLVLAVGRAGRVRSQRFRRCSTSSIPARPWQGHGPPCLPYLRSFHCGCCVWVSEAISGRSLERSI